MDTEDEIEASAQYLQNLTRTESKRLVVVSSAIHLPRAAKLLRKYNLPYTMAPTDFLGSDSRKPWPGGSSLRNTDRAIHEFVGMFWYELKAVIGL